MATTLATDQNVDGDGTVAAFGGGVLTWYVDGVFSGSECIGLHARPTGSALSFKQVASMRAGQTGSPIDVQLEGPHEVKTVIGGADAAITNISSEFSP